MTAAEVVTIGESMLRLSSLRVGPLAHSSTMDLGMGGAESNVAIGLSRLGTRAAWMSRLGSDAAGDLIIRELRAEGVTVAVACDHNAPTGLMIKERRTAGTVNVLYYRAGSAASRIAPDDIDLELVRAARMLHVTGITPALSTSAKEAVVSAIQTAQESGVEVSFDLNYRSRLWTAQEAGDFYRSVLPSVDIVFAGDDEAAIATGFRATSEELALGLHDLGADKVVIKRGGRGALVLADGRIDSADAHAITPLDTVGAGDAFVAGYLAEYLSGGSPKDCLALGMTTGAFACLSDGDWEGAPRRSELSLLVSEEAVTR